MSTQHIALMNIGREIVDRNTMAAPEVVRVADAMDEMTARRIAACWNACEGIPTDTLERYYGDQGGIDAALDEASLRDHTKAIQQRDQMLKALQAAVECSMVPKSSAREGGAMAYARQAQVADMIRDAIAACQPQPTVQHLPADDTEGGAA